MIITLIISIIVVLMVILEKYIVIKKLEKSSSIDNAALPRSYGDSFTFSAKRPI